MGLDVRFRWVIILVSKGQEARRLALEILEEVFVGGAYSNIALDKALKHSPLSAKDKALVTEIVYGSVSRKLTLEWYLAHYIKDRNNIETWVYYLLMMSLYQMLYLDKIPNHAIVYEAVAIAKERSLQTGAYRYVNALLRRLTSEELPDIDSIKRHNKRLSIRYSTPVWLVKELIDTYGEKRAVAILESLFVRNKASLRVSPDSDKEQLKQDLRLSDSLLAKSALVSSSGHFSDTRYFREGQITIQDESSQLVAPTLALKGDEIVLDACSAPGGKTTHIASYLSSGHVVALDLYDHKLQLIKDNAKRLHLEDKIQTKKLDATKVVEVFGKDAFDKALVDAPCSGFGLIRRKPDIKYNKANQDMASLAAIQLQILDNVCQTIRKGGIITYSTCTIFERENRQVIEQFLKEHPNFTQVKLTHDCPDIVTDGYITITPEQYGTDGFFIAQVRREA
ncbi:16S rRNA (cytosine(967)-C(5))-methyltransferase RsmB [Streptococcus sp. zg-JUN1979]|uniref:16S rRNA (cytosine(967)-C(5))-methyltransferase RsmB n=1 Tax=Streptococcus sp. zg-JUN1979 TaxID=3391450 RepID=UPI0039A47C61